MHADTGVQYDERLMCPLCCKAGRWGDDAQSWSTEDDLEPGQTAVECPVSGERVVFRPANAAVRQRGAAIAGVPMLMAPAAAAPAAAPQNVNECSFFFIDAAKLRAFNRTTMPHHQQLLQAHPGMLVQRTITFEDACNGKLIENFLTVSHRWMAAHDPDEDGTQLQKIKEHLEANPQIKFVWYDVSGAGWIPILSLLLHAATAALPPAEACSLGSRFLQAWCLPQGERTPTEMISFRRMLKEV